VARVVNGAGLTMAAMDLLSLLGRALADVLDGGAAN